ncbi:unnamed protein product [Tuber melanosporum]|uniref:DNA helicase n=1 Tax=Tuber melanosporum (strain Mel28) TaxID=656061 RepID=D5GP31_TUBMM|nr:uncharacterized protein GSTUM_00011641001 [Tuber melanosporum]CAZ86274.1 unnamed protein product [Tuber melanosporum]
MDIPAFAEKQIELLQAERDADITLQTALLATLPPIALLRHGFALTNLLPISQRTGFGGRTIIDLEPDPAIFRTGLLPPHGIRQGDIVRVEAQPGGSASKKEKTDVKAVGVEGVVHRVFEGRLAVAVEAAGDEVDRVWTGKRLWVVKVANEITFKRMEKAMGFLKAMGEKGDIIGLADVLSGRRAAREVGEGYEKMEVNWFDEGLNDSQKQAVRFALASEEVALILGPPGTGKTQTLLEIILQLATPPKTSSSSPPSPKKILVCGPSNISVDNIVLRLPSSLPVIRMGHPARLLPKVIERSLDNLTRTSEQGEIITDVRNEMDDLLSKLKSTGKTRMKGRARKEGWETVRHLRGEYREREKKCVTEIVRWSEVVLATLHGAGSKQLWSEKFDVVIIDEGSQALEAQCWIPLLLTNKSGIQKLILAGDPMQLPPTIKSQTTGAIPKTPKTKTEIPDSLEITLFSRLLAIHGGGIKCLLTTQYRMHATIMHFPSQELYNGSLIAAPSVAERLLCTSLPYPVTKTEDTSIPLLFIDTQGGLFPEDSSPPTPSTKSPASESKSNTLEARLVAAHTHALIAAGVRPEDIGVLTPYSAQVSLITKLLRGTYPAVEVNTVDSFQGREKEAVVFSLVRSNDKGEVGFLKDKRRVNVAVTRPRCHLCVVGDAETVGQGGKGTFLGRWIGWLESAEGVEVRYADVGEMLAGWAGGIEVEGDD